jgi:hemoglobin
MTPQTDTQRFRRITEESITLLVDAFYARVRRDLRLGPVFEAAIVEADWPAHLATMQRFWSSVMLTSGRYSGNPVAVHRVVQGMDRALFPRWLALFEATARDLFAADLAAAFARKAQRIATSLQLALFHRLVQPPEGLERRAPEAT